ncbi:diacylglycerol diphosphate phosphatase / phosphatidate phosphatase [Nematocida sp. AWRm80]|nr:diacylglycerol diphosphate phosphatase / phosphatidate phosphatase [Nematocida sp. AWRm80]
MITIPVILVLCSISILLNIIKPLEYLNINSITPGREYITSEYFSFITVCIIGIVIIPILMYLIRIVANKKGNLVKNTLRVWLGLSISNFIVNLLKFLMGKQRPDYHSRLKIFKDNIYILEGRRSFPSGHSSLAAGSILFLISTSICSLNQIKGTWSKMLTIYTGILLPMALGVFICTSRVLDNRHDIIDVLAGAIIALISNGCIIYRSKSLK